MKRIISILLIVLCVSALGLGCYFLFRKNNVESIEVVGDMQTIYFVNETTDVNFNQSKLKVTYKDGTSKLFDLSYDLVKVKNFSTSVVNDGLMKLVYKSHEINVKYQVVYSGLYYLKTIESSNVVGSSVNSSTNNYVAGLNESTGADKTTAVEMIYFYNDGFCDYYTRTSSTASWYMDDGHCDNRFNYSILGNKIIVNLGTEKKYEITASFSSEGVLSLNNVECEYFDENHTDFLKSKIERTFAFYEMKTERVVNSVSVNGYGSNNPVQFEVSDTYESSGHKLVLKVDYKNDNFLKTVYVRFHTSMLIEKQGFNTNGVIHSAIAARAFYKSIGFNIYYTVIA
jgi:hypothetical protein